MNSSTPFPWKATIISIAIIIIAMIGALTALKALNTVNPFSSHNLTTTFIEDLPFLTSTHGNVLEVARSRSNETIKSEDAQSWWGIYTGTTVAEIRAPVTFRYHILLSDQWKLAAQGNVCFVCAPRLRASEPPAIDTGSMEKRAESGWARFDKTEKLDELERSMTGMLSQRAADSVHLNAVRETCRLSVAEFVKTWLIQRAQWTNTFGAIVVVFPDEGDFSAGQPPTDSPRKPTLQIQTQKID